MRHRSRTERRHMQRRLDEKAASMGEPRDPSQLKEQIAYFLRERKDDERRGTRITSSWWAY
jgi:hypothetical protein